MVASINLSNASDSSIQKSMHFIFTKELNIDLNQYLVDHIRSTEGKLEYVHACMD